jgi:type IV pilus assembly protein PilN
VILINLLPHREEKRKRRKQAFFTGIGLAAVAGVLIAGGWWFVLDQLKAAQEGRNAFLQGEIKKLEAQIKEVANLRAEIEALKARQKSVEDLQTDRNMPVHLLNDLVAQTPDGVFLTSVRQTGQNVAVTGVAQTNERVSELLRNTLYNATWLSKPELVEIVAQTAQGGRRQYNFAMRLTLKRPQAAAPAASAPTAPAAKSS